MKPVRTLPNGLVFRFAKREKRLFLDLLKLYPVRVPTAQPLSKSGVPDPEVSQRMLDEALAENRAENQRQLEALFGPEGRFVEKEGGWELALTHGEMEMLLQVLNDIRVGSWTALGCPEIKISLAMLNARTAPRFWAMEVSGHFEGELLAALLGNG